MYKAFKFVSVDKKESIIYNIGKIYLKLITFLFLKPKHLFTSLAWYCESVQAAPVSKTEPPSCYYVKDLNKYPK